MQAFASEAALELIRRLREQHPDFFEQAGGDVLNYWGYGATEQRGRRRGGAGDGGVDGVIDQDALGLSQIYVQAKRYGVFGTEIHRIQEKAAPGVLGIATDSPLSLQGVAGATTHKKIALGRSNKGRWSGDGRIT
ncbi:MAG: restriction endonuclease [Saprospiraceae bacterium]|nr:restriction endonuclease [Saprospiraceae bacterium]